MGLTLNNPDESIQLALEKLSTERARRLDSKPETIRKFYDDPLGFVRWAWNWGVGNLEFYVGPDENQTKFLSDLGEAVRATPFDGHTPIAPIRMSISSAHGTGKSTLGAWIAWWILSTRPYSVGTVTAGNYQQLEERTWSDIMYWGQMCRTRGMFDINKSGIYHRDRAMRDKWKVTPKTAKREKSQSFAGQHAGTSTSWFLLDEASEVPDDNWRACYTGLTDGAPMIFAWGQMIQNSGEFYNVTFGQGANNWNTRVFDGRTSAFTNKTTLEEWKEEYGEDSDFYRVRVLGLPPRASSLQFIGQQLVDDARKRDYESLVDEPLVVGYDAANGGMAKHAFWFRRGLDAKSIPPIFLPGDTARDVIVAKVAEIMSNKNPDRRVSALFGDQAFGAVIIERLKHLGYKNVFEVNFGGASPDRHQLNMRAYIWSRMKMWMELGAIPDDEKLCQPFMAPGSHHTNGRLVLESKESMAKRGVKSPDGPDALALTFSHPVALTPPAVPPPPPRRASAGNPNSWMAG